MKLLYKGIAAVLFYLIACGLMIYAATRSLDFIQKTLPPDQAMIGYLALLATSGGMIGWLMIFLHKAEGVGQKVIAGLMVLVDLGGEFALMAMDTLYQSGQAGMIAAMTADEIRMIVIGMSILIGVNIGATVAYHLFDPGHMREMRESFVKDKLESETMKLIEKRGEEIARDLGPQIAEQWAADFEARFASMQALGLGNLETKKAKKKAQQDQAPTPLFSAWPNGHKAINAAETDGPGELIDAETGEPVTREGKPGTAPAPFRNF